MENRKPADCLQRFRRLRPIGVGHKLPEDGTVPHYGAYSYATKAKGEQPWIGKRHLGIDKGLVLLTFENHSTQLIWGLLHQNAHIQKGLQRLEFRHGTK